MPRPYSIEEEQRKQFAGAYLLEKMINGPLSISILLEGDDQYLEPVLEYLMARECIEIESQEKYVSTEKGREVLLRFLRRYHDFLKHYEVYGAVDLAEGEFAFEDYFEYDHEDQAEEDEWRSYLREEQWEDLRVAVAEFKNLDPVEIVFMSFLNENRFGKSEEGWQFDLLLGTTWDEILEICNTALSVDELGYEDEDGSFSGEAVIKDVITQGAELNIKLRKQEEELFGDIEETREEEEEERDDSRVRVEDDGYAVYESYCDPYFVSPCWGPVIFF
jgi:hypothetical protein